MTENDALVVDGYRFQYAEDADLARIELEKIKLLESRMDYNKTDVIIAVYNKAIQNRTFKTPVGFEYLRSIREFLIRKGDVDEAQLKPIPMYTRYAPLVERAAAAPTRQSRTGAVRESKETQSKGALRTSIATNIILAILIAAMFLITLYNDHPNILNYRTQITNEYATWEQELTEREQKVRERERELQLDSTQSSQETFTE